MATLETNTELGRQIVADARQYVLHSWSVQDALDPIPVAGGEGRYFWDYDGKRYLDFASQLVNVSIGHQHPRVVAAIKEQAEKLCTIGPPMATEPRSTFARRAGHSRSRADARSLHVPLPSRSPRSLSGLHGGAAPGGDPPVRGRPHGRRRDPRDGRRDERNHCASGRLPAGDPGGLRPAR